MNLQTTPSFELPQPSGANERSPAAPETSSETERSLSQPEVGTAPPAGMPQPAALPSASPPAAPASALPPAAAPPALTPAMADDVDVIEREWVEKAKAIVERTKHDPHVQNKELSRFKAEYLKKRYNKDVKVAE